MNSVIRRRKRLIDIRTTFSARDYQELERIKDKLRHRPPPPLQAFEADILLAHLEAPLTKTKRGTPAILTDVHRWIAIDYWWTSENGETSAAKIVARRWGKSVPTVRNCAGSRKHKKEATEFVRKAKAEAQMRPRWAIDQMIKLLADSFQELGKESNK